MSRALSIETAVAIKSVETPDTVTIVEGTPVAEDETTASLLPATVKVTDEDNQVYDYAVTWDIMTLVLKLREPTRFMERLRGIQNSWNLLLR